MVNVATNLQKFLTLRESGFADGRSEASPDSEQIERTARMCNERNSVSVEQIQDRLGEGAAPTNQQNKY